MFTPAKAKWCCENKQTACPDSTEPAGDNQLVIKEHNCHSREMFSPEKAKWCCENEKIRCPDSTEAATRVATVDETPEYNCNTREVWSEEKKEWCCKYESKGCPDSSATDTTVTSNLLKSRMNLPVRMCCKAMTAACLACKAEKPVEEYCSQKTSGRMVPGCEKYASRPESPDDQSATSPTIKEHPPIDSRPSQPRYLDARNTEEGFLITWVKPQHNFDCAQDHYRVLYRPCSTTEKKYEWRQALMADTTDTMVLLDEVPPGVYQVRVVPVNAAGVRGNILQRRFRVKKVEAGK